jgi:hypothetical protein
MFTHIKFTTLKTNEVIVPKDKLMIVKFSDTFFKAFMSGYNDEDGWDISEKTYLEIKQCFTFFDFQK